MSAPHWDTAPRADGSLADWKSLPRQPAAGDRLELAMVQDDERLSLLLEGRDPAWARALAQGQVELRIGIPDERGRRRVLRIARQETTPPSGLRNPPTSPAGAGADDPGHDGDRVPQDPVMAGVPRLPHELVWLWVLVGEDYQDERRLPLRSAPTPVAVLQLDSGRWFLEVELPRERVEGLLTKPGRLELELATSAVRGDGRPAGISPPSERGGPGGGRSDGLGGGPGDRPGGGGTGGGPGDRPAGGGMGGAPGAGPGGGISMPTPGSATGKPAVSGLPLKITVLLSE
jgi:hypothetical protein